MKMTQSLLAAGLLLAMLPVEAEQIASIDVFTIDGLTYDMESQRLSRLAGVPVYVRRIDGIFKFETELSANLPNDESQAYMELSKRLGRISKSKVKETYSSTVDAIMLARKIGVNKVPAVVFDHKYIVYGLDPMRAYDVYEQKRIAGQLIEGGVAP